MVGFFVRLIACVAFVTASIAAAELGPIRCGAETIAPAHVRFMGPLTVNPSNPRYFVDGRGKAILITGSHTWANLQDINSTPFDYRLYIEFLRNCNHNFFRLWAWEQAAWISSVPGKMLFAPLPYERTGPGKALDGGLKFDLARFDKPYFDRLRLRVMAARERGIYVSVMLFNGFSIEIKGDKGENPWGGHPLNAKNNVNGVDGDPRKHGDGHDTHTLRIPEVTALQEKYVRKVIDTLNDLDNVLWEISNESHKESTEWQYHMIDFIHKYETAKGKRHPVIMTAQYPGGENNVLFGSPAEAISPNEKDGYKENPPVADGRKVIISDTDHLWGVGGDYRWVWKTFLRGHNPIFMDPYDTGFREGLTEESLQLIRRNMGYALTFARRINLVAMTPQPNLASSGYCLSEPGKEYLAYAPNGRVDIDLTGTTGTFNVEWLDPHTGAIKAGGSAKGGALRKFVAPFDGDAVLYMSNESTKSYSKR